MHDASDYVGQMIGEVCWLWILGTMINTIVSASNSVENTIEMSVRLTDSRHDVLCLQLRLHSGYLRVMADTSVDTQGLIAMLVQKVFIQNCINYATLSVLLCSMGE